MKIGTFQCSWWCSDGKWEHSQISGNGNLWKFLEILKPMRISGSLRKSVEISILDFHKFPQISINFRRFFKNFPKISGKFLKMVKWVKLFCLNSCLETKHLSNSSLIFNIKKGRSNFGHVLNIFYLLVILRYFLHETIPIPESREYWELQCSPFLTN